MRRCLQLAANGLLTTKPNPMVGAVIVAADGRIIGEGFTSPVGGPHAEVNAFASVRPTDEALLPQATIYVSLEPCSHWGHTPPCCDLIISKHVKRCVCGCVDPFAKVQGRGIQRMRDAGIEVTVGVLEAECMAINRRFMTFNEQHRPYILLKWAQTANGYIAQADRRPLHISTPLTQMLSHKLRSETRHPRERPATAQRASMDGQQPRAHRALSSCRQHPRRLHMVPEHRRRHQSPVRRTTAEPHRGRRRPHARSLPRAWSVGRTARGDRTLHYLRRHCRTRHPRRRRLPQNGTVRRQHHQMVRQKTSLKQQAGNSIGRKKQNNYNKTTPMLGLLLINSYFCTHKKHKKQTTNHKSS